MTLLEEIQAKFARDEFEYTRHAVDQALLREISVQELREAVRAGEIIEDYPQDKYGPSCLIMGFTRAKRPIHMQCSYPQRPIVKVITVYEPTPTEWVDYRVRR